jgi:hypothetical protein
LDQQFVNKPFLLKISYKNTAKTPIPVKSVLEDGAYKMLGGLKSTPDNKIWSTELIEISPEKLKTNCDGKYCLSIDLRDFDKDLQVFQIKILNKTPIKDKSSPASVNEIYGFEDRFAWGLVCYPPQIGDYKIKLDDKTCHSGKRSLMVECLKKDETTSWGGAYYDMAVKGGTNYKLSLFAKAENINEARLKCYYNNITPKTLDIYEFKNGSYDWKKHKFLLRTPENCTSMRFYFQIGSPKGKIWFDDIKLEEVDKKSSRMLTHNGKVYLYDPRAEERDPELPDNVLKKYETQGCIPYLRKNLRGFYPDSVPQKNEIKNDIKTFVCPGECASGWFMLYGLKDIKGLSVSINDDLSCENKIIKGENITIKQIKCWAKPCNDEFNSHRYYIIPELLEKNKAVDLGKHNNVAFWVQMKIPEKTGPGTYVLKLQIKSGGKLLFSMPVSIEVLPFMLESPKGINWIMHSADLRSRYEDKDHKYTDEELCKYLSDMADYGITGIFSMPYGNLDYLKKTASLVKKVGFKGPFIVLSFTENKIKRKYKIKGLTRSVFPEMKDPEFQKEVVNELKRMDAIVRAEGINDWYYHGFGEVNDFQPEWIEHGVFVAKMAKKAGVKLYTTLYPIEIIKQLFPYAEGGINSSTGLGVSSELNFIYLELAKKYNISSLTLSGIYTGQTGGMMPNRYMAGFLIYKAGAQGHVSWTYQRVRSKGGPNSWGRICLAYPAYKISSEEVSISTLQWEGIREGIIDYKYLYVLRQWIKKAKDKGLIKEAQKAQNALDKIIQKMPWGDEYSVGNSYSNPGNFSNEDAMECRRKIADIIIELKDQMEKRTGKVSGLR